MTYDIHAHMFGSDPQNGNKADARRLRWFAAGRIARQLRTSEYGLHRFPPDGLIREATSRWIAEAVVDRVVLLALDWVHRPDGSRDAASTVVAADNDYVADAAESNPKVLFGASIHPYREDSLRELSRLADRGACLVKWIPSAQRIRTDHPVCYPFYEALAEKQIPLLCHTGIEHVIPGGPDSLNDPARLKPALERGVTVIAAHLGAPATLYERSFVRSWAKLAVRYGGLYGDISALAVPLRATLLRLVAGNQAVCARLIYGSDYPNTAWPRLIPLHLGFRRAARLGRISNPFDRSLATVQSLGLPEQVFTRAGEVLRVA